MNELIIVNNALGLLGEAYLTSYTQSSNRASEIVSTYLSSSIDETLVIYQWNQATAIVNITQSANYISSSVWAYGYDLPSDCLQVRKVNELYNYPQEAHSVQGEHIVSNTSGSLQVEYTKRIMAINMDVPLAQVTSYVLAKNICMSLTKNPDLRMHIVNELNSIVLPRARNQELREEALLRKGYTTGWVAARSNYMGY